MTDGTESTDGTTVTETPGDVITEPVTPASGVDWRSDFASDDLKSNETLGKYQNAEQAAQALVDAQRLIGAKGITVPGKDASPEDKAAFFNSLGRPEKADGYELPTQGLPEGVEITKESVAPYLEAIHGLGLTSQQAAGVMRIHAQALVDIQGKTVQAMATMRDESVAELKREFGLAYDDRIAAADNLMRHYIGEKGVVALMESGLNHNVDFMRGLIKLAVAVGSDEILGEGHTATIGTTPSEAKKEIEAMQSDKEFVKRMGSGRMTPEERTRWDDLHAKAFPKNLQVVQTGG